MNSEHIRLACIGCGRIAQDHLDAISMIETASIVGVVDINIDVAQSVANQFECDSFTSHMDLFKNCDIDAVLICTPPVTHSEITSYFLDRGIHVLCEKPLATNTKDGEKMWKKARDADVICMMATKFRFVEDIIKAKGIIESGKLGNILFFENTFSSYVDMSKRWNSQPEISGGGVLIDNGTHSLDIAKFLLGGVDSIQAVNGAQIQNISVEDSVKVFFKSIGEVLGSIDLSWSINKNIKDYVSIYGTEGSLSIGWSQSHYIIRDQSEKVQFGSGYNKRDAFLKQHRHFIDCVRGVSKPIISMEDGVNSIKMISSAYKSMIEKKWIKI